MAVHFISVVGGQVARRFFRRRKCNHKVLFCDELLGVEVNRCENCNQIPDLIQASMWEFAEKTLYENADIRPISRRFAIVKRIVVDEINRRNYVGPTS